MNEENLGTLILRREMPEASGMDAMEARLVVVQEVPPKREVQFFAIRGEERERMTSASTRKILLDHVPQRPITELSEAELLVEVSALRLEADRMRPVYAAAKAWRAGRERDVDAAGQPRGATGRALIDAVDVAAATEDP